VEQWAPGNKSRGDEDIEREESSSAALDITRRPLLAYDPSRLYVEVQRALHCAQWLGQMSSPPAVQK